MSKYNFALVRGQSYHLENPGWLDTDSELISAYKRPGYNGRSSFGTQRSTKSKFKGPGTLTKTKTKKKRNFRRNATGNMSGDFIAPFRFGNIKQNYKPGIFLKYEQGCLGYNDECMYTEVHAIDDGCIVAIFLAILRKLATKWGCPFYSPTDKFGTTHSVPVVAPPQFANATLKIGYKLEPEGVTQEMSVIVVAPAKSWAEVTNLFVAQYKTLGSNLDLRFMYASVYQVDHVTTEARNVDATIDLTDMRISFAINTVTIYQNRTGGSSNTDTSADSIKANPINGTRYLKYGNILSLRRDNSTSTTRGFSLAASQMAQHKAYNNGLFSAEEQALLRRPPQKQAFENVKVSNKFVLHPGQLHKSTIMWEVDEPLNSFMKRWDPFNGGAIYDINVGTIEVIGWDKTVHTGEGSAAIQVGMETNCTILAKLYAPKRRFFTQTNQLADNVAAPP